MTHQRPPLRRGGLFQQRPPVSSRPDFRATPCGGRERFEVSVRVKVGPAADHLNEIGAVALALAKHGTLADKIIAEVGWCPTPFSMARSL